LEEDTLDWKWGQSGQDLDQKVTVIEYLEYITPGMDREISNEFQKILNQARN
jgi:pyruvate/2-oxoglutarate dehydrogenase complex dihydrolipoamide dehydrogenase (E3) component